MSSSHSTWNWEETNKQIKKSLLLEFPVFLNALETFNTSFQKQGIINWRFFQHKGRYNQLSDTAFKIRDNITIQSNLYCNADDKISVHNSSIIYMTSVFVTMKHLCLQCTDPRKDTHKHKCIAGLKCDPQVSFKIQNGTRKLGVTLLHLSKLPFLVMNRNMAWQTFNFEKL